MQLASEEMLKTSDPEQFLTWAFKNRSQQAVPFFKHSWMSTIPPESMVVPTYTIKRLNCHIVFINDGYKQPK